MLAIKKHSRKLKIMSDEMPNAPYLNRCASFEKNRTKIENSGKNNEKNTRNN